MGEKNYNVNLASEFYVLSMLHRLGFNALLTLGNKKSVDILIEKEDKVITIDVKAITKKNDSFPIANVKIKDNHFIVFVCFMSEIENPTILPEVYIVPSVDLEKNDLIYIPPSKVFKDVQIGRLRKRKEQYFNRWDLLKI